MRVNDILKIVGHDIVVSEVCRETALEAEVGCLERTR